MSHVRWSRLAWAAAAPLLLAGAVTLPSAVAAADPACSAWNGGQPVNPGNFNQLSGIAVVITGTVNQTTTCGGVGQGLVVGQSPAAAQQEPFATAVFN